MKDEIEKITRWREKSKRICSLMQKHESLLFQSAYLFNLTWNSFDDTIEGKNTKIECPFHRIYQYHHHFNWRSSQKVHLIALINMTCTWTVWQICWQFDFCMKIFLWHSIEKTIWFPKQKKFLFFSVNTVPYRLRPFCQNKLYSIEHKQ